MTTTLSIIGLVGAAAAIWLVWRSVRWAGVPAYAALWLGWLALPEPLRQGNTLIYWGVAQAFAIMLMYMLSRAEAESRRGLGYLTLGALAGAIVGLIVSANIMVLGAVVGLLLGSLAWVRTPMGRDLSFPSRRYVNFLAAKGLPAVVTIAVACMAIYQCCLALTL